MGGVGSGIKGHRTYNQKVSARNKARTHGYNVLLTRFRKPGTSKATKTKLLAAFKKLHRGQGGGPTMSYRHRQAVAGVRASIKGRKRFG